MLCNYDMINATAEEDGEGTTAPLLNFKNLGKLKLFGYSF